MADDVVLIGGQALKLWAERYSTVPEIESAAPFTSKDIDFGGEASHVERCAVLLGGSARVYAPKDRSFCAGVVMLLLAA